jgi:hypothetical protein
VIENPKTIVARIDADLDLLLSKPRMWGDDESVEMQFLTYMSLREFILNGDEKAPLRSGRGENLMKIYFKVLEDHFGTWFQPACCLLNRDLKGTSEDKTRRLCEILQEVRSKAV